MWNRLITIKCLYDIGSKQYTIIKGSIVMPTTSNIYTLLSLLFLPIISHKVVGCFSSNMKSILLISHPHFLYGLFMEII